MVHVDDENHTISPLGESPPRTDMGEFFIRCIQSIEDTGAPLTIEGQNQTCVDYFVENANKFHSIETPAGRKENVMKINKDVYTGRNEKLKERIAEKIGGKSTFSNTRAVVSGLYDNPLIDPHGRYCTDANGNAITCIDKVIDMLLYQTQWTQHGVSVNAMFFGDGHEFAIDFTAEECKTKDGSPITCFEKILDATDSWETTTIPEWDISYDYRDTNIRSLLLNSHNDYTEKRCTVNGERVSCFEKIVEFLSDGDDNAKKILFGNSALSQQFAEALKFEDEHGNPIHGNEWVIWNYTSDLKDYVTSPHTDWTKPVCHNPDGQLTSCLDAVLDYAVNVESDETVFHHAFLQTIIEHPDFVAWLNRPVCRVDNGEMANCVQKVLDLDNHYTDVKRVLTNEKYNKGWVDLGQYRYRTDDGTVVSGLDKIIRDADDTLIGDVMTNTYIDLTAPVCTSGGNAGSCIDKLLQFVEANESPISLTPLVQGDRYNLARISCQSGDAVTSCLDKILDMMRGQPYSVAQKLGIDALLDSTKIKFSGNECKDANGRGIACIQKVIDTVASLDMRNAPKVQESHWVDDPWADGDGDDDDDGGGGYYDVVNIERANILRRKLLNREEMFKENCRLRKEVTVVDDDGTERVVTKNVPMYGIGYLINKLGTKVSSLSTDDKVSIATNPAFREMPKEIQIDADKTVRLVDTVLSRLSVRELENYYYRKRDSERLMSYAGKALEVMGSIKCDEPFDEPFEVLSKTQLNRLVKSGQWTKQDLEEYKKRKREWEERKRQWEETRKLRMRECYDKLAIEYANAAKQFEWVDNIVNGDSNSSMVNRPDPLGICGVYDVYDRSAPKSSVLRDYHRAIQSAVDLMQDRINGREVALSIGNEMVMGSVSFEMDEASPDRVIVRVDVAGEHHDLYIPLSEFLADRASGTPIEQAVKQVVHRDAGIVNAVQTAVTRKPAVNEVRLKLIISRRPADMFRASTCQHWSSCLDLREGCNRYTIGNYIPYVYIAYLATDELAPTWLARMWLIPGYDVTARCVKQQPTYGLPQYTGLLNDAVNTVLYEHNVNHDCKGSPSNPWVTGYKDALNSVKARCIDARYEDLLKVYMNRRIKENTASDSPMSVEELEHEFETVLTSNDLEWVDFRNQQMVDARTQCERKSTLLEYAGDYHSMIKSGGSDSYTDRQGAKNITAQEVESYQRQHGGGSDEPFVNVVGRRPLTVRGQM